MNREFSAGGIVFKEGKVLITQSSGRGYWGFPKGKIDPGEDAPTAALREVHEEGGVEAKIIQKIGDSKYVYTRDGEKIFKVVTIFLMEYISGNPQDHDWEVSEAKFVDPEEALKTLSFSDDKTHLKKAVELKNG
jgi:8-oxo-dGTP pyrophosphatase MutT (NUDIX family)